MDAATKLALLACGAAAGGMIIRNVTLYAAEAAADLFPHSPRPATTGADAAQAAGTNAAAAPEAEKAKLPPSDFRVQISKETFWEPGRLPNGFLLVTGAAGAGKSAALRTIGRSLMDMGLPLITLDFHNEMSIPGQREITLSGAPSSQIGVNPLEIDIAAANETGLHDVRQAMLTMITRAVPSLGHNQAGALKQALVETYRAAGIDDRTPETWSRPAPTAADLMANITNEGLINAIDGLFGHPCFNRAQNINIDEIVTGGLRLGLKSLPDDVRYVVTDTMLRRVFSAIKARGHISDRPESDAERFRACLLIDEARIITAGGKSKIVEDLVNEARKFGLAMLLASQSVKHFPHDIRNAAATKLILRPGVQSEAEENGKEIGVPAQALLDLRGKGHGFWKAGAEPVREIQVQMR